MDISVVDDTLKPLIEEVLVKMLQEKREVFYDIFVDAIEDIALGSAIQEGRKNHFISEEKILALLEG
jgi:hypothetical protein